MSVKLKIQQDTSMQQFKIGDRVRFSPSLQQTAEHLHNLNVTVARGRGLDIEAVHTVTDTHLGVAGDTLFVSTDLLGSDWLADRFELVEDTKPGAKPTSSPFAWSCVRTDPDLSRGYTEECSEYRACQNEKGDWVIEASRKKIIAQAADEDEATRIADALNSTIMK